MLAHQCGPEKHRAFQAIVRKYFYGTNRAINLLEVGSWAGGSAIAWTHALLRWAGNFNHSVTCVDPWTPYFDSSVKPESDNFYCGSREMEDALKNNSIYELFCHNVRAAQAERYITPLREPSARALPKLAEERFDLIFVDGKHDYLSVIEDVKLARKSLKLGGILCGDDLDAQMHEVNQEFCRKMSSRDFVQNPENGVWFHPGVTHAVHDLFGQVAARNSIWGVQKTVSGWQNIEIPDSSDIAVPTAEWFGVNNWPLQEQIELAREFDRQHSINSSKLAQVMANFFYQNVSESQIVTLLSQIKVN